MESRSRIACAAIAQPVRRGARERGADGGLGRAGSAISSKPVKPVSSERNAFCSDFAEGAADGHGFAHRFHRGGEERLGAGKFLEGEARESSSPHSRWSARTLAGRDLGDVVLEFVERVAARPAWRRSWRWESRWPWKRAPRSATRAGSSRSPPCGRPCGLTANCTLEPPVSTPISRNTAIEAERMR